MPTKPDAAEKRRQHVKTTVRYIEFVKRIQGDVEESRHVHP